jgi:hypothetical protein
MQVDQSQNVNSLLYHGKHKDHVTSTSTLAAYSVVITSYTMLANECGCISTMKGNSELVDLLSDDDDAGARRRYVQLVLVVQRRYTTPFK